MTPRQEQKQQPPGHARRRRSTARACPALPRRRFPGGAALLRRGEPSRLGLRPRALRLAVEEAAAAFAGRALRASDTSYASRSQSVIGGSTWSRCVTCRMCAIFVRDEASVRRTSGPFCVRPRKTTTSRAFRFGRTKK